MVELESDGMDPEEGRKDPEDRAVDGHHDTLISNAEYREAFNEFVEDGHSEQECHILAHIEVWGRKFAGSQFDEKTVDELVDDDADTRDESATEGNRRARRDVSENREGRGETESYSLDDF